MGDIKSVGIIGAGQMGNGIAHVCALAGYDVLLSDMDPGAIDRAIETIEHNLHRQVHRQFITDSQMNDALGRIKKAPTLNRSRTSISRSNPRPKKKK
jgi:3-hydroxybutyryl-CoA dehydrogenase